ncbi:murein transglycosylase A [Legionella sp. PATHC032]|uniref:murein transglycosylase A n=1 Tax=Legionella sp. PATHC032 TaxID=2992039 RepID=UPI001B10F381|nr:murein transglycosylase A [Legionella sp. PATHC032]MCW8421878.1 murein transglycosylase A [Legionella sp. PATHC032]HAZ7572167.1 murein transglycosylase A [Legionella pneumophila]HBA1634809.1 murein transglycosylase A [Legionella pneumophila]
MKSKLIYLTVALAAIILSAAAWWWLKSPKPTFRQVSFKHLPGWENAQLKKSLETFQTSCRAFLKQNPERVVGTEQIDLQAKDWHPACHAALKINPVDEKSAKLFFEKWFAPVEFYDDKPVKGLFTGYYMPLIKGSYTKSKEFSVPIYELPSNLVTVDLGLFLPNLKNKKIIGRIAGNKVVPFYTREEINKGAIKDTARVLVWIHSPVDRLFLEIQGSGIIELEDGKRIFIGYDGQNGAPYTAIAGVLIKKGIMTKHNASMQRIKKYLEAHPKQMDKIINQNKSFVFFRKLSLEAALGSQGVALTPGYSLAIDKQWIPMGAPLWLNTTRPDIKNPDVNKPMQRLMIAQDTGGAIRGKVRGDVFWGGGDKATLIAGHMKNEGHYWLLLPAHALSRLAQLK